MTTVDWKVSLVFSQKIALTGSMMRPREPRLQPHNYLARHGTSTVLALKIRTLILVKIFLAMICFCFSS